MKYTYVSFLFLMTLFSHTVSAEELNAGFVQGLWYSNEHVFVDTPTRVYVALRNNTEHDLTGTVLFTDNGKRIGSSYVSTLSGRLVEAWVDWVPTYGEHKITAYVSDAELHVIGKGKESIDMTSIVAEDTLLVDYDTDHDGIGNETDTDDDNDTVSDLEEQSRGTNPVVANPQEKKADVAEEPAKVNTVQAEPSPSNNETSGQGLERFVENPTADALLSGLTSKVEQAKESLDTYRKERNEAQDTPSITSEEPETKLGTYTENATITRTKIETKNSFLSSFVSGMAAILQKIYTLFLWILSKILSSPSLLELALLLSILYTLYRVARGFGRRPNM